MKIINTIILMAIFLSSCCVDMDEMALKIAYLEISSGNFYGGEVETVLDSPIDIYLYDQEGDPISGATVNFTVAEGSLSRTTSKTDAEGEARVIWTLGSTLGTQTLTITTDKPSGFYSVVGSPTTVEATVTVPTSETIQ